MFAPKRFLFLVCSFFLCLPIAFTSTRQSVAIPLTFEQNQGQAAASYVFLSRHQGVQALFSRFGPDFVLSDGQNKERVLEMRFQNASNAVQLEGAEPLPGKDNYFHGAHQRDWITAIPTYGQVAYQGLFPGIDLLFHGNSDGSQLEHDFVVSAGADPASICFQLMGADKVRIDHDGQLVVSLAGRDLVFKQPQAWQTASSGRVPVAASFAMVHHNAVTFRLGHYNHALPLTIDPVLVFGTYLDGTGTDTISQVVTDNSGNIYVTGTTSSSDFPLANAEQAQNAGAPDAFISKLDPTGHTLLYSTYLGGSGMEAGSSIAVDSNGNVAVSRITSSSNFPQAGKLAVNITTFTDSYNFLASLSADGSTL